MLGRSRKKEEVARSTPRHEARFRVRSRDLPGYKGISHDLSRTGIQLETEDQLAVGRELELELEFDRPELKNFVIPGKVVWSRQDEGSRTRWLNGLVFLPHNDEHQRALARVSTVLQARESADLKELLEEANKLDPDREGLYEQTYGTPFSAGRVYAPVPNYRQASPPAPQPEVRTAPAAAEPAPPPHPGVYIPIQIRIEAFHNDREKETLLLLISDGVEGHCLEFPRPRMLTDYGVLLGSAATGLFSTVNSEVVRHLHRQGEQEPWRHYRFLNEQGEPLLEIVSHPFQVDSSIRP